MSKSNKLVITCLALVCYMSLVALGEPQKQNSPAVNNERDVSEEMSQINKSLEGLLSELALIKREATGRLSQIRNKPLVSSSSAVDSERIRQTKVSKFVLKRVAELELESLGMRDEMSKLFRLQKGDNNIDDIASLKPRSIESKQEDIDFDDAQPALPAVSSSTTPPPTRAPASEASSTSGNSQTTQKSTDTEEAAQIGFDLEALKRLGEQLESEIEARQAQRPESLRSIHEQLIKLVDNMVQTYLANMRRTVQRFSNFIDNRRNGGANGSNSPRQSPASAEFGQTSRLGHSVVDQLSQLSKHFREFNMQWARSMGRQSSPLIDRIPPRGVELWRDFWDTVRKQIRRINQEFWQMSRDMNRLLTGRQPSNGSQIGRDNSAELLYMSAPQGLSKEQEQQQEMIREQFQEFYDKLTLTLSKEQQKMEQQLDKGGQQQQVNDRANEINVNDLIDEQDDEATKNELIRNVALRQQIQQEINVFGSIFDIMRQFIQRLRESTSHIRDVLTPPGSSNDNNAVTPGPSIKPTVDQLLEDTINSQRNINGQSKPVLMPNQRPQNIRGNKQQ